MLLALMLMQNEGVSIEARVLERKCMHHTTPDRSVPFPSPSKREREETHTERVFTFPVRTSRPVCQRVSNQVKGQSRMDPHQTPALYLPGRMCSELLPHIWTLFVRLGIVGSVTSGLAVVVRARGRGTLSAALDEDMSLFHPISLPHKRTRRKTRSILCRLESDENKKKKHEPSKRPCARSSSRSGRTGTASPPGGCAGGASGRGSG